MKLLFLFEELSGYFLACVKELALSHEIEVHVIHKEVNVQAPFSFSKTDNVNLYDRSKFKEDELTALIHQLNPSAIYCGGWSSSSYKKICRNYVSRMPVILGFDNQWTGSFRQRLAGLLAFFYITPYFNRCFVPGMLQKQFARKLGFSEDRIFTGAYSADQPFFASVGEKYKAGKEKQFPRRFVFAGRYVKEKGIDMLWQAFSELATEGGMDWELWCLGTGPEPVFEHPRIRHLGFVQPEEMPGIMEQTGVFVLPSRFEPWGVVVHEFAAAGFPLICSDAVGGAEAFLREGVNGYVFPTNNTTELKQVLRRMMKQDTPALLEMGRQSTRLAKQITPMTWAATVFKMIQP